MIDSKEKSDNMIRKIYVHSFDLRNLSNFLSKHNVQSIHEVTKIEYKKKKKNFNKTGLVVGRVKHVIIILFKSKWFDLSKALFVSGYHSELLGELHSW